MFPVERSQQKLLVGSAIVFSILPTVAVGLRLLARRLANRRLDWSDYLIVAACINVVAYQGLNVASVLAAGGGYHVAELSERFNFADGPAVFLKMILAQQILWATSLALTKLSIVVLYSRIFTIRSFVLVSNATACLIIPWAIVVMVGSLVICQPTPYLWDPEVEDGHCGDSVTLWICTGALNILTDVLVLLLPMPYFYGLELALYKRIVLMATFSLGAAVTVISGIRLGSLAKVDMTDPTYTVLMPIFWSALEPCLGITLACVPLLRPLLARSRYSPTGTAKAVGRVRVSTMVRSRPSRSMPLENRPGVDDGSTTQLQMIVSTESR